MDNTYDFKIPGFSITITADPSTAPAVETIADVEVVNSDGTQEEFVPEAPVVALSTDESAPTEAAPAE
jgi:hypothetical protein